MAAYSSSSSSSSSASPSASSRSPTQNTQKPSSPCGGCGGEHWQKDCPHKHNRCENCHRLGHLAKACRATVLKTPDGRIDVIILPRQGSGEIRKNRDRTQEDRLRTAAAVLQEVLGGLTKRTEKDRKKRVDKKKKTAEATQTAKRPRAAVAVVEEASSSDEEPPDDVVWAAICAAEADAEN
eukprot:GHVS01088575.1.p2 GENE.GHVS01088575.1~~GHVS01088575.1.p2  ORF type:complete len:181 (-),score=35.60 GHVS01088575.1:1167-1709(-)